MRTVFAILVGLFVFATPAYAQGFCTPQFDLAMVCPRDHICVEDNDPIPTIGQSFVEAKSPQEIININTSANYSLGLGETGVELFLLGTASIENTVPAEAAFVPAEPIPVIALNSANLRERPSADATVMSSVTTGTEVLADGLSPDGEWLRIVHRNQPMWIFRSLVQGENLSQLPAITGGNRSVMQEFTLRTGNTCGQDLLVINALPTEPARLIVNGADIAVQSTIALSSQERFYADFANDEDWTARFGQILPDGVDDETSCRFMHLMAVDGTAFLNAGLLSVPRGYAAYKLDCQTGGGTAFWDKAEPMFGSDLQALQILESLPTQNLHRPVTLVTLAEISQTAAYLAAAERPASPSGDGQPTSTTQTSSASNSYESPDCPGFRPTHPLTGIAFGFVRFYWDAAAGATSYQVNLYNYQSQLIETFATAGPETSVRVATISPLYNDNVTRQPVISYEIIAYKDGGEMCRTPLVSIRRDFDPDPDCPPWLWFSGTCEDYIANEE